jgi:hypothetical protein
MIAREYEGDEAIAEAAYAIIENGADTLRHVIELRYVIERTVW